MPVARYQNKLCHFAHIPKCGGSSVEDYLQRAGVTLAFLDTQFSTSPANESWNISSPQHIDGYSFSRLFPSSFFDFSFAVVRNPYTRFISAYKFQLYVHKTIDERRDINDFIEKDLERAVNQVGVFDNHFRPQTSFLLPGHTYKIFKLESGLEHVKAYLDTQFFEGPKEDKIGHRNKSVPSGKSFILAMFGLTVVESKRACFR